MDPDIQKRDVIPDTEAKGSSTDPGEELSLPGRGGEGSVDSKIVTDRDLELLELVLEELPGDQQLEVIRTMLGVPEDATDEAVMEALKKRRVSTSSGD